MTTGNIDNFNILWILFILNYFHKILFHEDIGRVLSIKANKNMACYIFAFSLVNNNSVAITNRRVLTQPNGPDINTGADD